MAAGSSKYFSATPVAESVPYDPDKDPNCDLTSENVQDAIDELCKQQASHGMISITCLPCNGKLIPVNANMLMSHNMCLITSEVC